MANASLCKSLFLLPYILHHSYIFTVWVEMLWMNTIVLFHIIIAHGQFMPFKMGHHNPEVSRKDCHVCHYFLWKFAKHSIESYNVILFTTMHTFIGVLPFFFLPSSACLKDRNVYIVILLLWQNQNTKSMKCATDPCRHSNYCCKCNKPQIRI